jgi:hypothetical protein
MSRSAILAAVVALFSVSLPYVAEAQRIVPRNSITKKPPAPADSSKTGSEADRGAPAAVLFPGTGSIVGAVLDSLHDEMLSNAGVAVMELAGRHAVTTAAGAFRIDSIPPGRYVLELTHPVLDSLGIRVTSDTIPVAEGQVKVVELAIPSVRTITSTVCTPAKLRFGPGVILGRVLDADTERPAVGAEVSVAWTETAISTTGGVQSAPRVRKAVVAADGTYRICGVPAEFTGSLQAIRGGAKTAEVPIEVTDRPLSLRMLFLPPAAVAASGAAAAAVPAAGGDSVRTEPAHRVGRAVITGIITNAGGVPVTGARVSVQGSPGSASTGPDGKFTLTGVMPGTQSVLVRRVGYAPVEKPLDVTSRRTNQITVRLGAYAPVLSSVDVKAKADPLAATGFERRRKLGFGKFMDYDAIQKAHPTYTSDVLRRIPGLYVVGSGSSASVVTTRGNGCVAYNIDNNPVAANAGQSIDDIVGSQDLASIEFYNPIDVPMELSAGSNGGCALLVIWTKGKLDQRSKK